MCKVVYEGLELSRPGKEAEEHGLTDDIWELMRSCWRREPSARLTTSELRNGLSELVTGQPWKSTSLRIVFTGRKDEDYVLGDG